MAHHGGPVDSGGEGGAEAPLHAHGVGNFSIRAAARLKREVLGIALGGGAAAAKAREKAKRFHHNLSNEYGFQHAYGPHGA